MTAHIREESESDDKFTDLEIKVSYLEETIETLNDVIYKQNIELSELKLKFTVLTEQLKQLRENMDLGSQNLPHEKPPHY